MKTLLALSLLFATQMAFANQGVYGTWKFPQMTSGPLVIDATISIAQGQVTMRSVCQMFGQQAVAQATAPANITDSEIQMLGEAHNEVNNNGIQCHANIDQGSMS